MVGDAQWDLRPQKELRPRGGVTAAGDATRGRVRERPALAFPLFPPYCVSATTGQYELEASKKEILENVLLGGAERGEKGDGQIRAQTG